VTRVNGFVAVSLVVAILLAFVVYRWSAKLFVSDRGQAASVRRLPTPSEVRTADLPAIVQAMSRGSAKPRWFALIFGTPDRPSDDDAVNLNLSVENGSVGFDWVLLGPRNIEDQEKFRAFARAHGSEPVSRTMNGVSYLRVERADVAKFTASIVTEMYQLPATEPLGFEHDGFEWP
jgi:hypothetical protein